MVTNIDESKLTPEERLGLAYCRLNCFEWDNWVGEKPFGYDEMDSKNKSKVIENVFNVVKNTLGEERSSKYWWIFNLQKSEQEWSRWYFKERISYLCNDN